MAGTLQDCLALGLTWHGERQVKETTKYRVFSRAKGGFYYLGRAGSFRVGATSGNSHPVPAGFRAQILALGRTVAKCDVTSVGDIWAD